MSVSTDDLPWMQRSYSLLLKSRKNETLRCIKSFPKVRVRLSDESWSPSDSNTITDGGNYFFFFPVCESPMKEISERLFMDQFSSSFHITESWIV